MDGAAGRTAVEASPVDGARATGPAESSPPGDLVGASAVAAAAGTSSTVAVAAGTAAAAGPSPAVRERFFFIDNLRVVVIALVIVLHASITYMWFAPQWWYVIDPDQSQGQLFMTLVLLIDVPLMPALFFAAGYFALPSIEHRGISGFLREKTIRVGAPWVIGVVFLAPLATYMTYVSRHVDVGYLQFWTHDFLGPLYQQSVYWYLGALFVAFLITAWVWAASPALRASTPRAGRPSSLLLVGFVAATALGSALVAARYGVDDWQPAAILVLQPARVAFYVGYFALGVYAERRRWFTDDGYRPEPGPWAWGAVIAGFGYLALRLSGPIDTVAARVTASVLFSVFCFAALMGSLAVFQRVGNWSSTAWRILGANSYGIYYVHPLVLYPLAFVFVGVTIPPIAKVTILVVVTFTISLAVSALVLKRVPGLRRMF
jgi:glucan biosynthesis protein C